MIAALAMMATMAVPFTMTAMNVSATNVTIDTSNDNAAHTYSAYQIFTGTYDDTLGLTITGFGTGYNGAGLAADTDFRALVITPAVAQVGTAGEPGYVAPAAAVTVGSSLGTKTDAASVAQAIEKLNYADESAEADTLATILQKYIGTATPTTLSNTAQNLGAGYWIVLDSYAPAADEGSHNDKPDAVSKFILRVTGQEAPITVTPKKSYPTVVKKVYENVKSADVAYERETDKKWNDVADYCIGDSVPFKLYGTLPDNYADYEHYYYKFTDTLASQFTVPTADRVTVKVNGTAITDTGKNMRVNVAGQVITVSFEDIKAFAPNATDVITVEYSAVLNNTAVIGLNGQENKVDLTYSNNPNITYNPKTNDENEDVPKDDNGTPENTADDKPGTDKTPEDKVVVFTYEVDINKIDANTKQNLEGAEFQIKSGSTEIKFVDNGDGTYTVADQTLTAGVTTTVKSDANGLFKLVGLDDGTYTLTETKAPDGYPTPTGTAADFALVLTATTVNNQAWNGTASSALTAIAGTLNNKAMTALSSGSVTTNSNTRGTNGGVSGVIENSKSTELPSTGGMGTILFYTVGGIMVVGAGVVLVTKKRSKNEQ